MLLSELFSKEKNIRQPTLRIYSSFEFINIFRKKIKSQQMYNFGLQPQYGQNIYSFPYYPINYLLFYPPYFQFHEKYQFQNLTTPQLINLPIITQNVRKTQFFAQNSPLEDVSVQKYEESVQQSVYQKQKKKRKYYGTKNTEANIINQTFSFMNCSNKSRKVLQKILKEDKKKIDTFYIMIKLVKKNLKKYVNRTYLRSIFDMDKANLIYKLLSKGVKRLQILPLEQFKNIFRKLVFYYFHNQMTTHILSSNRLSKTTISQHLKRRRQIMHHIFYKCTQL